MAYSVVTREAMQSESVANLRKSFKYQPSGVDTAVENGNVVVKGALIDGQREVYTASTPTATSKLADILLVTTPEVLADERLKNLSDFRNEAGSIATGDKLFSGDIFSVTAEGFTGTPAKGNIVELQAGTKLNAVATLTAGSTQVGTIIDYVNGKYAVQVL